MSTPVVQSPKDANFTSLETEEATPPPPPPTKSSFKKWGFICLIVGFLLLLAGILFGTIGPSSLTNKIENGVTICDLDIEENFFNPFGECEKCIPFFYYYHPFNIVNAIEVLNDPSNVNLRVQETGPYVFRKYLTRSNVEILKDDYVAYDAHHEYIFQSEMSCESCEKEDTFVHYSVGFLAVMTQSGGESNFIQALLNGAIRDPVQLAALLEIPNFLSQFLKALYGMNSLNPTAMDTGAQLVIGLLRAPSDDARALAVGRLLATPLTGIHFSGLFIELTVLNAAVNGASSLLAGLSTVSSGKAACTELNTAFEDPLAFCSACDPTNLSTECLEQWNLCRQCTNGRAAHDLSVKLLCPLLEKQIMEDTGDEALTQRVTAMTCGTCGPDFDTALFCLARLPGSISKGEIQTAPNPQKRRTEVRGGCDDPESVGLLRKELDITAEPLWSTTQDLTQPPTALNLLQYSSMKFCGKGKDPTVVCSPVRGHDPSSFPPEGASINGLASKPSSSELNAYVTEARQNITLFQKAKYKIEGITVFRFEPSRSLLAPNAFNVRYGTGRPTSGVQSVAYQVGFSAFVSFPFFMHGDPALFTRIDLFTKEGQKIESAQDVDLEKYRTYLGIEPSTGKPLDAHRRLMGSLSVPRVGIPPVAEIGIATITAPNWPVDVIVPYYWGDDTIVITKALRNRYKTARRFGNSFLPTLIVGVVVGALLLAAAFHFCRRNATQKMI